MSTALDLITDALKNLGVVSGTETPTADAAADGLTALNRMLDSWNTESLNIYTISAATYPLVQGQMIYQIGPTATDFVTTRPQKIKNANIILNTTPTTRIALTLIDDDQWAAIKQQQVQSNIPQVLYNDGSWPNSNLYLWGQPAAGLSIELYTWQLLTSIANLTDDVSLPPGYEEAILYNLAVRLAPMFDAMQKAQAIIPLAQAAKARIQTMNNESPLISSDAAAMGQSGIVTRFNVYTGE